jgi:hypothetical protein
MVHALDDAYERLMTAGFELPNGFVNHGPMACEALAAMGLDDAIGEWSERFARVGRQVDPVAGGKPELGRYEDLPAWIGAFEDRIAVDGWKGVVAEWVPRLMPALDVALFHGAIRVAHAVRAIHATDTAPRRSELARALGYWAARYRPGAAAQPTAVPAAEQAAAAAQRYLATPNIFTLHGVTGAMAVAILVDHIPSAAVAGALGQLAADHAALYGADGDAVAPATEVDFTALGEASAAGRDPHQVKLVEACQRGWKATADPAFAAAAARVMGRR